MFNLKCVLIIIIAVFKGIEANDDLIVQLPEGKIKGHILSSENGEPYYAFHEIPYAAPPIGKNRFQLPKDPEPWSGIRDATRNTVICYQQNVDHENLTRSEDCLQLNVYSPVKPGTSKLLPVVVWIHGGGLFKRSSTFQYVGPKYVVGHGVVVVTVNYRLGTFGFLTTGDDNVPPNRGMRDQYKALEWVHENIGLFGGSKSRVTLAGESAGGLAVSFHLLGPWKDNKVLFNAAIIQSGSALFYSRPKNTWQDAFEVGRFVDRTFSSNNSKELLKVLQNAPVDSLLNAVNTSEWVVFLEKQGIFKYPMYEAMEQGNFKKIPILIGFNSEEQITSGTSPDAAVKAAAYDKDPSKLIGWNFNISDIDRTTAGNLLKKIYTNTSFENNIGAYVRSASDNQTTTPTIKQAVLQSKIVDVYLYQLAYKGELGMRMDLPYIPGCERVAHAEDLNYLWDSEINTDLSKFPAADGLMLHRFVKLWTNFVKYYNPTPNKDPLLQNVTWPKIDPYNIDDIPYLNMNVTMEVKTNPRYYQKVIKIVDKYITSQDIR